MFHIRNAVRIVEYLLLSALTLSTGCLAAAKNDFKYYFTTRRPFWERYFTTERPFWERYFTTERPYWERFTDTPILIHRPTGQNDVVIFLVVLFFAIFVIGLLSYFCHQNSSSTSSSSSNGIIRPVSGAVTHPPPRNLGTLTSPIVPTAPVHRGSADNSFPLTVSFTNTGYQPDQSVVFDGGRPGDRPPDYAAFALGNLTSTNSSFPAVVQVETPPPQYQNDGKPFR